MIKKIRGFVESVQFEMKKVSWPNWEELRGSTYIVLGLAVLLGVFLFVVDQVLSFIMRVIL
ncbi:MAG: preprotein translocase subunit SecE [Fidelibacterota bacterium]